MPYFAKLIELECHLSYTNVNDKLLYVLDSSAISRIFQSILKPSVVKNYIIELCQDEGTTFWKIKVKHINIKKNKKYLDIIQESQGLLK